MKARPANLPRAKPHSYEELVRVYLPRKIHDRLGYQQAVEVVDWLAGHDLNPDQEDFLDLVSDLVVEYESQQGMHDGPASPVELLQFLVEENGLTTREIGTLLGIHPSTAARILKGQRSITPEHAKKLGARFAVRPSRFLDLD
ncbi:MAG TPA: helix-turn-helix domain-containing protein [Chthoniobacterales bacterium]